MKTGYELLDKTDAPSRLNRWLHWLCHAWQFMGMMGVNRYWQCKVCGQRGASFPRRGIVSPLNWKWLTGSMPKLLDAVEMVTGWVYGAKFDPAVSAMLGFDIPDANVERSDNGTISIVRPRPPGGFKPNQYVQIVCECQRINSEHVNGSGHEEGCPCKKYEEKTK